MELQTPSADLCSWPSRSPRWRNASRSGFVVVLEDTSELLRAQKAAAWHEVARRIAHEIKNPLTPIALSAERIAPPVWTARSFRPDRHAHPPRVRRHHRRARWNRVKTLVDEFSQFARFPAAQPVPGDLNEVVENGLAVFAGRLDGIDVDKDLAPDLPPVNLDREQFKRVVVNLVDNAAEAMQDSLVKRLFVAHAGFARRLGRADRRRHRAAASRAEDKEKLFLPYFSTKNRGTGLGLAIVSHIVAEHERAHPRRRQPSRPARASSSRFRSASDANRPTVPEAPPPVTARPHPGRRRRTRHPPVAERRARGRRLLHARPSQAARPAWRSCARATYDVVLLDIWLPGMDGMEVLARIQEIPFADRPVVVMISGHGTIETAVKATKLGAFDFLEKPLTIEKVTRGASRTRCGSAAWNWRIARSRKTAHARYASSARACP